MATSSEIRDFLVGVPAYVRNGRFDVLASNTLGAALYSPVLDAHSGTGPPNTARFLFLDPRAGDFFIDWDRNADHCVAVLRGEAGRNPYDPRLTDLVGELSTRSQEFRVRWARHDVRDHRTGVKRFHHPVVGDLTLDFEALELAGDPGQRINVYTAEPASPTAQSLALLASWASTSADELQHQGVTPD